MLKDEIIKLPLETNPSNVWYPFDLKQPTLSKRISVSHTNGSFIYAENGNKYIDMTAGWWTAIHGFSHPLIISAIEKQLSLFPHVRFSDLDHNPAKQLSEKIISFCPSNLSRVFFADSGSDAVEAALKIAIQYYKNCNQNTRKHFISFEGGYHGETFGAMSVSNTSKFFEPFAEHMFPCYTIPFPETWENDETYIQKEEQSLEVLKGILDKMSGIIAAFIMEPLIQGASGMRMCRPEFIKKVSEMVQSYDVLVICDEVMTGMGRTGSMLASNKANIEPDIICLGKALSGGVMPISATVTSEEIYNSFVGGDYAHSFMHGHSYAGNPLACAASIASIEIFNQEQTLEAVKELENISRHFVHTKLSNNENFIKKRINGSIMAFDISEKYNKSLLDLKLEFMQKGILIRPLGRTIYFIPPYCRDLELITQTYETILSIL